MLTAVIQGKRRGTGLSGGGWDSSEAVGAEDILTATVFERLGYLPDDVFADFLDRLLGLDHPAGTLNEAEFWPMWSTGQRGVEPDVVLDCTERDILVEAKRRDGVPQQMAEQLARELTAGWNEGRLRPDTVLLAVGGHADEDDAVWELELRDAVDACLPRMDGGFELACRSWRQVFQALRLSVEAAQDEGGPLRRLLGDIAKVYDWHGVRLQAMRWLDGLEPLEVRAASFPRGLFAPDSGPVPPPMPEQPSATLRPLSRFDPPALTISAFPKITWSTTS
ncbi:hypothetical protein NNJEOMEG_01039 [Fundidesulfovibrio magnetotacticus]|uniref:Uncharacterized protein n=1 Tax=Fundidesulfovibrio magnetotacticus TaxID=2730080 RepID=A0A6V8LSC1_9BACT|nr:hypothetical protein [Fundidesulfovibrio magnetotacticus]GFK93208.1 hypothetical protein NNJEOMEG_01039 [Fundidesulfovibrio magnetotacticus]